MPWRRPPAWTYAMLCAACAAAWRLGAAWDARLALPPVHGQIVAGQATGEPPSEGVFQRLSRAGGARAAEYGFVNFNQDRLDVSYRINEGDFKRYDDSFGYRPEEVAALRQWRDQETQRAYRRLVAQGKGQADVDAAAAALQREYQAKLHDYLSSRGFLLETGGVTRVDMPGVVRRNGPLVQPFALTFQGIADRRGYRSMDIIGSVLSFVQTALKYRQPDDVAGGKHTGGLLPPITSVVLGWGDCDTKTGVLASILANWAQMRMVGISVPGHYLMAVLQIPNKGDLFVEYKGLQYILLEPAGPAWLPPGQVAEETVAQLNASDGYKIYPFF